ncbi:SDR family oxidoreductase [Pendulispora brunnea]|uniref:SDR family oxidoreductase n=1 Tax=Pendulispora brunnea TaxID=2905690 RepID=A0ABZ2JUJ4_9BACT
MILVSGASGTIGRYVVKHLKARGEKFKALVRDEAKGRALECDFVVGDFDQPETIARAMQGVTRFFLNTNVSERVVRQQNTAIDLATRAGVELVVKLSSPGASPDAQMPQTRSHGEIEAHLRAAGIAWVILQPTVFMQNLLRNADTLHAQRKIFGSYRDGKIGFIDADDIGACAAAALTGEGHAGKSFVLTGGESLRFDEIAQKISTKLGETVTYVDMPVEQFVAAAVARGVPSNMAEFYGKMMTILASGGSARTTGAVRELTGREPRTFEAFLDDNIARLVGSTNTYSSPK